METLSELRTNILKSTREEQLNSTLANQYINLTLMEINDPAWAFEQTGQRGTTHLWSFNKRKDTLYASAEFSQLPRDLDKIHIIRQIESPVKLRYIPDEVFYKYVPEPTAEGTPLYYRLWEEEGLSTRLSSDDTIDIVSSSTADTTQTVSVVGRSTSGYIQSEVISLNGTTTASGTTTFDAGYPIRVSKSAATTGAITVSANSVTLVILGPEERSPRFKIIGLYPIPPGDTGSITAFANYGSTVTGTVSVTDADHGLNTGNYITISGTTNYNGTYEITYIDDDTFYITATWVATETGSWTQVTPLYLEYYTRIRQLVNDSDVPDIDQKWLWVVRLGAMAKIYQMQPKETLYQATQAMYAAGVRSMIKADVQEPDYIPQLDSHRRASGVVTFDDTGYGSYGLMP